MVRGITLFLSVVVLLGSGSAGRAEGCEDLFSSDPLAAVALRMQAANEASVSALAPAERLRRIATEFDVPTESFKSKLLEALFSRKLIHQKDLRLFRRNLIREDGGLCGPVCMANVLSVISENAAGLHPAPVFDPVDVVQNVVQSISQENRKDARYSTNVDDVLRAFQNFKMRWNLPDIYLTRGKGTPTLFSDFRLGGDTVSMIMFASQGSPVGHWVILISLNPLTREALVLDPQSDEFVFRMTAREREGRVELWSERHAPRSSRLDPANWLRVWSHIAIQNTGTAVLQPEMHERYRH